MTETTTHHEPPRKLTREQLQEILTAAQSGKYESFPAKIVERITAHALNATVTAQKALECLSTSGVI